MTGRKRNKGKKKDEQTPEEKAEEKRKEDRRNLIKDVKKARTTVQTCTCLCILCLFWFTNQAINDINSRIRLANEKKKSMSSWPLVVHDFFDIQVTGSNHTCKLMKKMSHDRSISPYIRGLLASGMRSRRR